MGVAEGHPEIHCVCAPDRRARERAVEAVLETARFAAETGARAVVLHAGRVPQAIGPARALQALAEAEYAAAAGIPRPGLLARLLGRAAPQPAAPPSTGEGGQRHPPYRPSAAFLRRRERLYYLRDRKVPPFLDALRASLDELLPQFESLGLRLGLENLPTFDAVPSEPEMQRLLEEFDTPALGYWHDIGHGQVRANMGFLHHASLVRRMAPRIVGMHLHDVIPPAGDHVMPPLGETDFGSLAFLADLDVPAVFEPAPDTPEGDIRAALDYVRGLWDAAQA